LQGEEKIGIEAEHFVVVSETGLVYDHATRQGGSDVLKALRAFYAEPIYADGVLVGQTDGTVSVTLEPGGQLECSAAPLASLGEIKTAYQGFLANAAEALSAMGLERVTEGYMPKGGIADLPLLPKRRYQYMYDYFGQSGPFGRNMMKGTAALQASVDYHSEKDFVRKFRAANLLSLHIAAIAANTHTFEGQPAPDFTRLRIWQGTDKDRCGLVEGCLDRPFGYEDYAKAIYFKPALVALAGGEPFYAGKTALSEIFRDTIMTETDVAYALSMQFFDVRALHFIEVRPADILPFKAAMGFFALIQAIFYTALLDTVLSRYESVRTRDYEKSLESLLENGMDGEIYGQPCREACIELLDGAYTALPANTKPYLEELRFFFQRRQSGSVTLFSTLPTERRQV